MKKLIIIFILTVIISIGSYGQIATPKVVLESPAPDTELLVSSGKKKQNQPEPSPLTAASGWSLISGQRPARPASPPFQN